MATPQDWRELRQRFIDIIKDSYADRAMLAVSWGGSANGKDMARGWMIDHGSESATVALKRFARVGAALMGYERDADGNEWGDWFATIRAEPLMSDFIKAMTFEDDEGIFSWEILNICYASSEYCEFLANGAAQPPTVPSSYHDIQASRGVSIVGTNSQSEAVGQSRQDRVDAFLEVKSRERGERVPERFIWETCGYKDDTQFRAWKKGKLGHRTKPAKAFELVISKAAATK